MINNFSFNYQFEFYTFLPLSNIRYLGSLLLIWNKYIQINKKDTEYDFILLFFFFFIIFRYFFVCISRHFPFGVGQKEAWCQMWQILIDKRTIDVVITGCQPIAHYTVKPRNYSSRNLLQHGMRCSWVIFLNTRAQHGTCTNKS